MDSLETLAIELGMFPYEVQTPRQSLDETTPGTGDVSGGSNPGIQLLRTAYEPPPIKMSDLSLNMNKDCSDYTSTYAFTFTYDPMSKQTIIEDRPLVWSSTENEELLFWECVSGKKKKMSKTRRMVEFTFMEQYEIFKKHFFRWLKELEKMIFNVVIGYTVCIESTKAGLLHAHAIIYSGNNWNEMVCQTSRVLWASISKGRVCAMGKAFQTVSSEKSWKKYITKNL